MENEISRVVNAAPAFDVNGTPFVAREHRNFAKSATASLIENGIDG